MNNNGISDNNGTDESKLIFQLFQERPGLYYKRSISLTITAVPFAPRFGLQLDTNEMEPLDVAKIIVACDHLAM
jgi:hypothetical protein